MLRLQRGDTAAYAAALVGGGDRIDKPPKQFGNFPPPPSRRVPSASQKSKMATASQLAADFPLPPNRRAAASERKRSELSKGGALTKRRDSTRSGRIN